MSTAGADRSPDSLSPSTDSVTAATEAGGAVTAAPELTSAIGELEQSMVRVFSSLRAGLRTRAEAVSPGLQPGAYQTLTCVIANERIQPGAVAESMMTDKSTVSRLLRQLEDRGLVRREADEKDRRIVHILPTEAAIDRVKEVRAREHELLYKGLLQWDIEEIRSFTTLLTKLEEIGR